mgnify:CR=1 FL=1
MRKGQLARKAVSVLTAFTLALPLLGQGVVAYAEEGATASEVSANGVDGTTAITGDAALEDAADAQAGAESAGQPRAVVIDDSASEDAAESTPEESSDSSDSQVAPSNDSVPVPGADAPESPTTADTHIDASVEDFASEEELDEAYSKLMMRSARDYSSATFADVLVYADQYVGLPYVWGGKDLYRDGGFDCSGFVNWVYNHVCGLNINSDYTSASSLYYDHCTPISESDARPGDIVFWKGTYSSINYISHVGIYCGNGVAIDAGDPIGYDKVTDIKNMNGKTAERVYGRLVTLSNTSIRLDSSIVKARVSDRVYTGSEQKPKPTVVAAGSVLKEGTDYTLSYSNNVKVGTASVTIRGKGNYSGSVTKTFKIYKDTFKAGTYMATSALKSNLVMDVVDGSTSAGAGIQLYSSNGTDAQRYNIQKTSDGYYTIQNVKSDLYLTLYTTWADLRSGQKVTQRGYTGGMSQKWCLEQNSDGTYTVVSAMDSNMALDVTDGKARNGALIQAWDSNGTAAQHWRFSSAKTARQRLDALAASSKGTVAAGTYEVRSAVRSSAVFDAANGYTSNGTAVQVYASNGTDAQRWNVEVGSDGYLTIKNAKSGLALDVTDGEAYSGAKLQLWQPNGTRAQKWVAVADGKGVKLVSALDEGLVVDLPSGSAKNGNQLQLYSANGTAAQRWAFDSVTKSGSAKTVSYSYSLSYIASLNQVSTSTLDPKAVSTSSNAYYQFMDCRGYTGQVSASQMNKIIDNTEKGRQGVFHGRGQAIIDAAKAANINEMYLMAHMMIETGWGTSAQASGKYFGKGNVTITESGKTYTKNCPAGTYYNFIGWGAYDSNPNAAYDYARYYGWNSVDAALKGAAEKLAKFYLYNGQETVYEMRWNPDAASLGKQHQYCTSTNWAESIGITIGYNYKLIGVTPKVSFLVPKYL